MKKDRSMYGSIAWLGIGIWIVLLFYRYANNTLPISNTLLVLIGILPAISITSAIIFKINKKNSWSLFTLFISIAVVIYTLLTFYAISILD